MAIKEFQIGPLEYFESGYLDGDYTQPNVSKFYLECDIDGYKGGRVITGVYFLDNYIDGTYFHSNALKATLIAEVGVVRDGIVEIGDYFDEGYFVDEYAAQRGSRFSVSVDTTTLVNGNIEINVEGSITALPSAIRDAQSQLDVVFTQTAYGYRQQDTDLFAFSDAALTAEVRLIRDYEAALPDIFDIATDFIRVRSVEADAEVTSFSETDTTFSRNRDTTLETQVAFSFDITPGFVKDTGSGFGVGWLVIDCEVNVVRNADSDFTNVVEITASGNNQAGAEMTAFSDGGLTADVTIISDIVLELTNEIQTITDAVKTTDASVTFIAEIAQSDALAGKLFDESFAFDLEIVYVARPIWFRSERLYNRPRDWYRTDSQSLVYNQTGIADGTCVYIPANSQYRLDIDIFDGVTSADQIMGHFVYRMPRDTRGTYPLLKYSDGGTNIAFEIGELPAADIYTPNYWNTPNLKINWTDGSYTNVNLGTSYSGTPTLGQSGSPYVELWWRLYPNSGGTFYYFKIVAWDQNKTIRKVFSTSGYQAKTMKSFSNGRFTNTNTTLNYYMDDFSIAVAPYANSPYQQFFNEGWGESTEYDPWLNVPEYTRVLSQFEGTGADTVGVIKTANAAINVSTTANAQPNKIVDSTVDILAVSDIERAYIGRLDEVVMFAFSENSLTVAGERFRGITSNTSVSLSFAADYTRVRSVESNVQISSSVSCDVNLIRDVTSDFEAFASQLTATVRLPGIVLGIQTSFSTEQYYFEEDGYFDDTYISDKGIDVGAIRTTDITLEAITSVTADGLRQAPTTATLSSEFSVTCEAVKDTDSISLQLFVASLVADNIRIKEAQSNLSSEFDLTADGKRGSEIQLYVFSNADLVANVDGFKGFESNQTAVFTQTTNTVDSLNKTSESVQTASFGVTADVERFVGFEAHINDALTFQTSINVNRVGETEAAFVATMVADIEVIRGVDSQFVATASITAVIGSIKQVSAAITDAMVFVSAVKELRLDNIYYKIPAEGWTFKISGETRYHEIIGESRIRDITGETRNRRIKGESRIHIID